MVAGMVNSLQNPNFDEYFALANQLDHEAYIQKAGLNGVIITQAFPLDDLSDPSWIANHWEMHQALTLQAGAPNPFNLREVDINNADSVRTFMDQHLQTHQALDVFFN